MSSLLESLYDHSPIFFQNLMVSGKGWTNTFHRFGKAYHKYRQFFADFDTWPQEKQREYQRQELIKFVRYAYEKSPFYHELYQGIDIDTIQSVDDLKKLPIVDKEMLRQNLSRVITIPKRGAVECHTGGTTGKALNVYHTKDEFMQRMAMLDHFKSRVGFEHRKMKRASFDGKHIVPPNQKRKVFWRYNVPNKQMVFSSFHLTEENMGYYIEELNRFKPDSLDGFFTTMCDLASYVERHQIALAFKPVAIFPTSETLTPVGRALLERVFQAKVYDQYASSEGAPFITECPHQRLHIELASGVFEHIDENSDEVLVTSFTTYGTPIIRYRIGDTMIFNDPSQMCPCGLLSPTVNSIQGRRLDFLYNAEGAKINSGNISNIFKNIPNALVRVQLIQDRKEEVTLLLEVDPNLYKDEYDDRIREEFLHKFGENTSIVIKHVSEIHREKSGKLRMIVNNVPAED